MPTHRRTEDLIAASRLALTNARDDAEVQALLAPYGYDPVRLDEGLTLTATLEARYIDQQTEYAEQYAASDLLADRAAEARATYMRHVKLARVAFARDTPGYLKLGLKGDRGDRIDAWMAQARQFYTTLQADADLLTALSALTVDQAAVDEAVALLDVVEAARNEQAREKGEAQAATRTRDDAYTTLNGFMSDFYRVAELALAASPQLRERLGMVEPS